VEQRIKDLLDKYLAGNANPTERAIVEQWFQQYYPETEVSLEKADKERIFKDLDTRIDAFLPHKKMIGYQWLRIAAVFLIAFTLGFVLYNIHYPSASSKLSYNEIRIPLGTKEQITLPDQSTVVLNSGSILRIPYDFAKEKRKVILIGEGYFKIKRDTLHPFVIHSGQLQTTVLGTSFNIKAYPEDRSIQVAVTSGRVKIDELAKADLARSLTKGITRNQILLYTKDKGLAAITHGNAELASSWKSNVLYFDNASIPEIARTLERWYNVKVTVVGSNCDPDKRYTLYFNNEPFNKVLNGLSLLTNTSCSVKNKEVLIAIKNCTPIPLNK
jgi:ferric-dicitrate binding protein FerR (iron transport regulator)